MTLLFYKCMCFGRQRYVGKMKQIIVENTMGDGIPRHTVTARYGGMSVLCATCQVISAFPMPIYLLLILIIPDRHDTLRTKHATISITTWQQKTLQITQIEELFRVTSHMYVLTLGTSPEANRQFRCCQLVWCPHVCSVACLKRASLLTTRRLITLFVFDLQ